MSRFKSGSHPGHKVAFYRSILIKNIIGRPTAQSALQHFPIFTHLHTFINWQQRQLITSNLGFSILLKDTTSEPGIRPSVHPITRTPDLFLLNWLNCVDINKRIQMSNRANGQVPLGKWDGSTSLDGQMRINFTSPQTMQSLLLCLCFAIFS